MKPTGVVTRVLLLLFLGWLYGGDVVLWVQSQGAEVTALSELPRLWLGLLGTVVTLGGVVVLVMARKQPPSWPPLRLFSIAALSLLFLDFLVLNSRRSALSSEEQALFAIQSFADSVGEATGSEAVPRDPGLLLPLLDGLGPVPLFVKGERVAAWKLELRERCAGPASDAGQASAGTLIYCVAGDRKQAWVTLVGTPKGQVFGPRAVVSTQGSWVGQVGLALAPEPELEPAEEPVWGEPTQGGP